MRYDDDEVEKLPPGQFKRLTGVKRETFEQMLAVLKASEQAEEASWATEHFEKSNGFLRTRQKEKRNPQNQVDA